MHASALKIVESCKRTPLMMAVISCALGGSSIPCPGPHPHDHHPEILQVWPVVAIPSLL